YVLWGIAFYHALLRWPFAHSKPDLLTWIFLLGGSLLCIAALPIVYWKVEFRLFYLPLYDQFRALHLNIGETIHANILASILALLLPILFALLLQYQIKRYQRITATLLFFILLAILVLTQSRGAYLAMVVALPLVMILRWPRLLYATPILLVIAAGVVVQLGVANVLDLLSSDGSLSGWAGRIDIWTQSVNAIYDFPFTGIGFGTFTTVIPLLYPLQVSIEGYPHAHNLFLQIGVDLGVGGLVAYCAILFTLFAMLWRTLRTFPRQSYEWMLAAGTLGSLVAMLVHGLLDAATWISKIAFFPWVLFALITLLFLKAEENKRAVTNNSDQ
ncbi:MAG: O-antigen ligase family protein, partial [Caldilineaceae bacterium]